MTMLLSFFHRIHTALNHTRIADFLAPLLLRLFLAPVMFSAGYNKAMSFEGTVSWFGNTEWGLGLPFPALLAFLATATELVGGVLLLLGLFTRYISIPLMFTMLVAIGTVHWGNGWFAIAPGNPATSMAAPLATVGFPGLRIACRIVRRWASAWSGRGVFCANTVITAGLPVKAISWC